MATLYIFCEGETEEEVLKQFLNPYWRVRFSHCDVIRFQGAGDLKQQLASEAHHILQMEPEAAVLCLIDLYREPFNVYQPDGMTHSQGFEAVRQQLLTRIQDVYHSRFGAFPVVMEPETWLLADAKLQAEEFGTNIQAPEDIEHPAEHLKRLRTRYRKRIDGKNLFRKASAVRVYNDNCPHFMMLVDWLQSEPVVSPYQPSDEYTRWDRKLSELLKAYRQLEARIDTAIATNQYEEGERILKEQAKIDREITNHAKNRPPN